MKKFRLYGKIRNAESGKGIPGLIIEVKDADLFIDEVIGTAKTGRGGSFSINFPPSQFLPAYREKPDIYLSVKSPSGKLIASTRNALKPDVERNTEINVDIPRQIRIAASLEKEKPLLSSNPAGKSKKMAAWTFLSDKTGQTSLMQQVQEDLCGKRSILELLKQYMDELYLNPDNNAVQFDKLMEIFRSGVTPEAIEGHVYGVWMFFRTGDQEEPFSPIGNILQVLLGTTLDAQCPWVGKTFTSLSSSQIDSITEGGITPGQRVFRAVNHFRKMDRQIPNNLAFQLFDVWNGLDDAPPDEQKKFGHHKNGGYIIAVKGPSIYPKTEREVFILNYRWKNLANKPPLCWLIDEVVQIAEGLYLGQILSATRRLLRPYDPARPPADYEYQTFGYFLMFSEDWNTEAQRLFPFLDIPSI
ncbi:MAG: hypothetical protein HGA29_04845 [Syntrophaceae bacterium]|nr:hypothetical protein [Syntrophaceae bacterium]